MNEHGLIATLAFALGSAFLLGLLARKLRLPPVVGYLLAGIAVGPFSPGFVADQALATQLADIGIVLLMFGVGIEFSLRDLLRVRHVALPGAVAQIAVTTAVTTLVVSAWGWSGVSGIVLGVALSIASTVVVVRALTDRGLLDTAQGHVALGWLIVQDLVTVLVLVLLPTLAVAAAKDVAPSDIAIAVGISLAKVALLAAIVVVVGTRVVPWALAVVARTGSRELFTLAVLALALGIAFASSALFGVSLALGAFLAGTAVSGSDVSHHAAAEALPLRDAFAVLFFVSLGMLFDPGFVVAQPGIVVALLAIVLLLNPLLGIAGVLVAGRSLRTGAIVGAGLAQIGEFAFIVSEAGRSLGLVPQEARAAVLSVALLSISLNPLMFAAAGPLERWLGSLAPLRGAIEARAGELARVPGDRPRRHAVLIGHGRVGTIVGEALGRRGFAFVVVDNDRRTVEALRGRGLTGIYGDGGSAEVLERAGIGEALLCVVATSDPVTARRAVENARRLNPRIHVVARTHSEEEWSYLRANGADVPIFAEREVAAALTGQVLRRYGLSPQEVDAIVRGLRQRPEA
ncbi:MAG: cation:proton antiporter [Chloroflexi bacterium]|nr:cation:proton antiporter [Chloroflexota bacterium]